MRCLVLVAALLPMFAVAQTTYTESEKLTGWSPKAGGGFQRNPYNPAYQSTSRELVPYSGGVRANTSGTLTGPAGSLPVVARSKMTNKAIGAAAARVAARAIPTVAIGIAIWDIYDGLRIRPDGAGGLSEDPGQDLVDLFVWDGQRSTCKGKASPLAAAACDFDVFVGGYPSSVVVPATCQYQSEANPCVLVTGTARRCSINTGDGSLYGCFNDPFSSVGPSRVVARSCPAVVDFSDPRYSVPGGPVGFDQKCPTGRFNRPISVDQASDRYALFPPVDQIPAIQDIWNRKGEIEATPEDIQGPASQVGSPETTTTSNPDGTSRTETKTPSYNYSYSPTTINYSTTVTTTVNNAGSVTTTTTTTNNEDKQDPEDQCVKNPDTVGCAKMDVPAGPDIETQEKTVSVTPDGGWGGDAGSCPAPLQTTVLGTPVVVDNTLFCQFLSGIRFAIIGVCGLIATLIFVGGFKES